MLQLDTERIEGRTCGEALIDLLELYGVDTVFGIPGVHTFELYRGLADSSLRHVLAKNEAGAGFMADGYARVTGKPGVCFLITGPGVTNATTPMGQAFADSVPMLVISSENPTPSLGKGWGLLHEITDQTAMTRPLTALSATAQRPEDVPELIGQAFSIFASQRPRPVHIAVPMDVLAAPATGSWATRTMPARPSAQADAISQAAELLANAERPVIMPGGGLLGCDLDLVANLAEQVGAAVIPSNKSTGLIPHEHPLNLGVTLWREGIKDYLASADVVLVIGCELSETDSFVKVPLPFSSKIIRVDIDPSKMNDRYPATVGVVADASQAGEMLLARLQEIGAAPKRPLAETIDGIAALRAAAFAVTSDMEQEHYELLDAIRAAMPDDGVLIGDMSQIVYTGCYAYPARAERGWHYAGGFCTLGCAMPMAIGAKLAQPDTAVAALAGDGGFMFTIQELIVGAELGLPLPVIVWNNSGLGEIKSGMIGADIDPVGVDMIGPDFMALAKGFLCHGKQTDSPEELTTLIQEALQADRPTLIEVVARS